MTRKSVDSNAQIVLGTKIKRSVALIHMMKRITEIASMPLRLVFRRPRVIFVCGMRRSGNHAFINWIANAIEGQQVKFETDKRFHYLNHSQSHKTLFLNEVNRLRSRKYYRMLIMRWFAMRRTDTLIVSAEDVNAVYGKKFKLPFWLPLPSHRIVIKRSILNLIASRLQHLKKSAAAGIGVSHQTVDFKFFKKLKSWEDAPDEFMVWDFDHWMASKDYRKDFLTGMNLERDIAPPISKQGGGSSFTGRDRPPTQTEAFTRFKHVDIPANVKDHLLQSGVDTMLSADELAYLKKDNVA